MFFYVNKVTLYSEHTTFHFTGGITIKETGGILSTVHPVGFHLPRNRNGWAGLGILVKKNLFTPHEPREFAAAHAWRPRGGAANVAAEIQSPSISGN